MDSKAIKGLKPSKELASTCGLFCPSCHIFIATQAKNEELNNMATKEGVKVEEISCMGCNSENNTIKCKSCKIRACAKEKNIEFCYECKEFPCNSFEEFQKQMPNSIEVYYAQQTIREVGFDIWFKRMMGHYSCKNCGTINSAYDMFCRNCNAAPANDYIRINEDEIIERF